MSEHGENLLGLEGATGTVNGIDPSTYNNGQNQGNTEVDSTKPNGDGLKSKEQETKPKVESGANSKGNDMENWWERNMESLKFITNLMGDDLMEEVMELRLKLRGRVRTAKDQITVGSRQVGEADVTDGMNDGVNTATDERSYGDMKGNIQELAKMDRSTRPKVKVTGSRREDFGFSSEEDRSDKKSTKLNRSRSLSSKPKTERKPHRSQELLSSSDSEDWGVPQLNQVAPVDGRKEYYGTRIDGEKRRNTVTYIGRRTGKGVPEPEKFDVNKDKDFHVFLDDFERYCKSEYSSDRRDWVKVLGNFLEKGAKDIYDTLRENDCDYAEVVQELEKWIKLTRSMKTKDYRRKFNEAEIRSTEGYYGFALRVEGLAKKVYGKRFKKPLKEKYIESVQTSFAGHLRQLNWNTRNMCGRSLTWEEIKEYAALQPREVASKSGVDEPSIILVENAEKIENGKKFKEVWPRSAKEEVNNKNMPSQSKGTGNECQCRCYRSRQWSNTRMKQEQSDINDQGTAVLCWFCGKLGHLARDCRYKNGLCAGCGAKGHFVRECPRNQRSRYPPQSVGTSESSGLEQNRENSRSRTIERAGTERREQYRERTPEQTQLLNL